MLGFFIDDGASLQFLTAPSSPTRRGKYGQKLDITSRELAQHVGATYNGLVGAERRRSAKKAARTT